MLLSMTGYGRTKLPLNGKTFTVEVKALNSKGLDMNMRLSPMFRDKEMEIRNLVASEVVRGKVDCMINNDPGDEVRSGDINPMMIKEYQQQIARLTAGMEISQERIFEWALQMPNVTSTAQEVLQADQWPIVEAAVKEACMDLASFRQQEGANMLEDLQKRCAGILATLEQIAVIDPERAERTRERLLSGLRTNLPEEQIDHNRFEQELIFYLEKMDITEEIIRLRSHCDYFTECLHADAREKGKKLAFISQEMGREINTIGAKSYHAEMQKLVVDMKDELEKIKEQLNNVL